MPCQGSVHGVATGTRKKACKSRDSLAERSAAILSRMPSFLAHRRPADRIARHSFQWRVPRVAAFLVWIVAAGIVAADQRPTIVGRMVLIAAVQQVGMKKQRVA